MNALLDKAEDPQKTIDLLLMQMRDQLKVGKQQLISAIAEEKMLRTKVQQTGEEIEKWQRRAELAVTSGDDELARQALMMKKRASADRDSQETLRAQQRARALELRDDLEKSERQLQQLEAKKATIIARYKQAKAGGGVEAIGASPSGPSAFDEFRRIQDKMDQAQAESEAMQEVQSAMTSVDGAVMSESELEARFAELESGATGSGSPSDDVQDELDALRKKLRVST